MSIDNAGPLLPSDCRETIRAGALVAAIRNAGQSPHPAYAMGMSRLSCVFCIMASRADLRTAARLQPALYAHYADLERRIGHTLSPSGVPRRS